MSYCLIYTTTASKKEANLIGKRLIELRLAACVNILAKTESMYRWKGKVEKSAEWPIIIKTRKSHFSKVAKLIRKLHSYSVPSILQIPISRGEVTYLKWIQNETRI